MKVRITKKVGKSEFDFQIDHAEFRDALFNAAFYATIPDKCTMCESENVTLDGNKASGYTFVKVRCLKCNATANMGEYKDGSGGFWKDFEKYVPGENSGNNTKKQSSQDNTNNAPEEDEDVPF